MAYRRSDIKKGEARNFMYKRKRAIKLLRKKQCPYSIPEIYDLFYYLSGHIEKSLIGFKKVCTSGSPAEFEENPDDWYKTIDKMIFSFHELANENPNDPINIFYEDYLPDMIFSTDDQGRHIIKFPESERNKEELRVYEEQHKKYEDKIQEGLKLFAKYFRDLWD